MPTFEHGGRALSLIDEGSGPPALLVHSGGLNSRQWRGLSSTLRARHRVLVPDLLGYGQSTAIPADAQFSTAEDLEMLAALAESCGQPLHLVGHSYGGLLALQLARRAPERVRSISLFEPVAFGVLHDASESANPDAAELHSMERLANDDGGSGGGDAWMEGFVDWWQGNGMWRSLPEQSRSTFLAAGRKTFLEVRSLLADRTPASAYRAIAAPALILTGERSPAIEQRVCERLAETLPHARLERIAKAGHMGPLTHMGLVNGLIAAQIAAADPQPQVQPR